MMRKKLTALALTAALLVSTAFGGMCVIAADEQNNKSVFDAAGRYTLIDESENFTSTFLHNNQSPADMSAYWVAGRMGRGLRVDSKTVVEDKKGIAAIADNAFTFVTWVKIKDDTLPNQSIMSIFSEADAPIGGFFNLSPNYVGGDKDHMVNDLNGLLFEGGHWDADRDLVYRARGETNNCLPENEWSYVAVSANGAEMQLFLNGSLYAEKDSTVAIGKLQKLILGDFFGMRVDAVYDNTAIYNKALTAAEIGSLYAAENAVPVPPDGGEPDPVPPTSAFDANGRYTIVDEEENFKDSVYRGEDRQDDVSGVWVDGKNGKGLQLAGNGDNVRFNADIFNEDIDGFTFSTWMYWQGDPTPDDDGGLLWQRMFCISGASGYINFSPWGNEDSKFTSDDGLTHLNGMVMAGGKYDEDANCYVPVAVGSEEKNNVAVNEWTHIALTLDGEKIKIYINGSLFAEQWCDMQVWQMNNVDLARLGSAFFESDAYYGIFDDTMVHNTALNAEQVKSLFTEQGGVIPPAAETDSVFPGWAIGVIVSGGVVVLGGGGVLAYFIVSKKRKKA